MLKYIYNSLKIINIDIYSLKLRLTEILKYYIKIFMSDISLVNYNTIKLYENYK